MRILLTIQCILFLGSLHAQDSTRTLSLQQVISIVKQYHPVARQAAILIEQAKADVTIARGGFDPEFYSSHAEKTFNGTNYYQYNRPQLTIPTWFGVEVTAGLEYLAGNRTNPPETLGETSYLGLSVPLAKNLLMDKRRAALQTAKIYREASVLEQRNIINNLLLDASKAYWYWMQQYQLRNIINNAVAVNEKRVQLVKTAYEIGERPAIDTTEAYTQLQSFLVMREKADMEFKNAALELSIFLWQNNNMPVQLPLDVVPADEDLMNAVANSPIPALNQILDTAMRNHPELLLYDYKLSALEIERKLKFQELLPTVNLKYNQLGKGYDLWKTAQGPLLENNFQYGVSLGLPLRLSEGRGNYRKAKLKITETQLQQDLKQVQVKNKVLTYFNELVALQKQVQIQERAYQNYTALQRGEELRFQAGESSLFLINARENKALEALQKLQELRTKFLITTNALQWSAGLLL